MNKKVKKIVMAGMVSSMLVTVSVNAEELGNAKYAPASYPVAKNITQYSLGTTTSSEDDFLQDLFGDVYEKGQSDTGSPVVNETPVSNPVVEPELETEEIVEDIEDTINVEENDSTYNDADKTVSSHFDETIEKLKQYAQSEDYATLKREAKKMFTEGIDFLFFDGEIDGFTREQMTEQGKKDIMNTIEGTGIFLDEYFPGFSDSFGQKYSSAKEFLGEKYVYVLDKIKGWIGEDTYEGASNMGRDFVENVGDLIDILGDSYQGWKMK